MAARNWVHEDKVTEQLTLSVIDVSGIARSICVASNDDGSPLVGSLHEP